MKKAIFCLLLLVTLCCSTALADTSFTGELVPGEELYVTAPFAATVEDVTVQVGENIVQGDIITKLHTTKIYAPIDGTVQGIFADVGDHAETVEMQYGGLLYIEPAAEYILAATTDHAYDDNENRLIHIGETVHLRRNSESNRRTGEAVVTAVNDTEFSLEITAGDLYLKDSCSIYRKPDFTYESRLGKGVVKRNNPVAVTGNGMVLNLHVEEGQSVKKGDLLLEMASDVAERKSASIDAAVSGVVAAIYVVPGDIVNEGQAIAILYPENTLEASILVSEYELAKFRVGDVVALTLDGEPAHSYSATVRHISGIPDAGAKETSYEVLLSVENEGLMRAGMSITISVKE